MNKKILIIEDNAQMLENTAEILELANYRVITAPDGKEGVRIALKEKPDLIICDIMMPNLDGYGVIHMLQKNETTEKIPFIFLTAKAEKNDFRKGMELGADDYLTKPYDDVELLNAVEVRLKKFESVQIKHNRESLGTKDFIDRISDINDLRSLPSSNYEVLTFKKRELIYRTTAYPKGVFIVKTGQVKVFRTHEIGKDLVLKVYNPGQLFGFLPLLEGTVYSDNAEAMEDCEILFIAKDTFLELIHRNALVAESFVKLLGENISGMEQQLMNLAYNSVRKRVADALLTLLEGKENNRIKVPRETLASIAGTAIETTIRTLSSFKEDSIIAVEDTDIIVLDADKLKRMRN